MDDLEKFKAVNNTTNVQELKDVIFKISQDFIIDDDKKWDVAKMVNILPYVINGSECPTKLTKSYGIRSQAVYLQFML